MKREERFRGLTEVVVSSAYAIAREVRAKGIFLYLDALPSLVDLDWLKGDAELFIITHSQETAKRAKGIAKRVLMAPSVSLTRMGQIKIGVLMALSLNLINMGDRIVCICGLPELEGLDTISVIEIGKEHEILGVVSPPEMTESSTPEVFQAVLSLALELAREGREGKPVGAIFVVGDQERVYQYSRQMIINPFKGYPPSERNILDPALKETLKEFSSLDGAFVISGDGVVMSAGRHLNAAYDGDGLPHGLGARHAAAAAITGVTKAIAITVSASTGTVTIFKGGKILTEIERP